MTPPPEDRNDIPIILKEIKDSRDPNISGLPTPDPDVEGEWFWAFQVFVGAFQDVRIEDLLPACRNVPGYVKVDTSRPPPRLFTRLRVALEGLPGAVWIRCFRVPGSMRVAGSTELHSFMISGGAIPPEDILPTSFRPK